MNGIEFLKTADGTVFDVCAVCYIEYLRDAENKEEAFEVFRHLVSKDVTTDRTYQFEQKYFTGDNLPAILQTRTVINKAINNLIEKAVDEEAFYRKIWDFVFDDLYFSMDYDKVCALFCLAMNEKIPYFKLPDPVSISDKEYERITNECFDETRRAAFIMNLDYEKKTDLASQLLLLLDQISDLQKKIVVLANALEVPYNRIQFLAEFIKNMQEDEEDEN